MDLVGSHARCIIKRFHWDMLCSTGVVFPHRFDEVQQLLNAAGPSSHLAIHQGFGTTALVAGIGMGTAMSGRVTLLRARWTFSAVFWLP